MSHLNSSTKHEKASSTAANAHLRGNGHASAAAGFANEESAGPSFQAGASSGGLNGSAGFVGKPKDVHINAGRALPAMRAADSQATSHSASEVSSADSEQQSGSTDECRHAAGPSSLNGCTEGYSSLSGRTDAAATNGASESIRRGRTASASSPMRFNDSKSMHVSSVGEVMGEYIMYRF